MQCASGRKPSNRNLHDGVTDTGRFDDHPSNPAGRRVPQPTSSRHSERRIDNLRSQHRQQHRKHLSRDRLVIGANRHSRTGPFIWSVPQLPRRESSPTPVGPHQEHAQPDRRRLVLKPAAQREGETMRSLLKRRAALLAAIVSVGDAAGALSTFVQAAHAKSTQEYFCVRNGDSIQIVDLATAKNLERVGYSAQSGTGKQPNPVHRHRAWFGPRPLARPESHLRSTPRCGSDRPKRRGCTTRSFSQSVAPPAEQRSPSSGGPLAEDLTATPAANARTRPALQPPRAQQQSASPMPPGATA